MKRRRDPKRGRHERARSPETLRYEAELLVPERPSWMPLETYRALCTLRSRAYADEVTS